MSRYIKQLEDRKLSVAYGFDHALGYFFQVFDLDESNLEEEESGVIVDESSLLTGMSNGDMYELMENYDVDAEHMAMVLLDLPF
jgi:hypothetical protein